MEWVHIEAEWLTSSHQIIFKVQIFIVKFASTTCKLHVLLDNQINKSSTLYDAFERLIASSATYTMTLSIRQILIALEHFISNAIKSC